MSADDLVWCSTAGHDWVRKVAVGPARYDFDNAVGRRCWLTVPVAEVDDWAESGPDAPWVNWPAEHVHPDDPEGQP